jgi:tetratricopeptide (TPR) repeat protein
MAKAGTAAGASRDAAEHNFACGRYADAAEAFAALDGAVADALPADRARLKLQLAGALHGTGRWWEAYDQFEAAADLRPADDLSLEIETLLAWSRAHEAEGNVVGARVLAADAFARARAADLHALATAAAYQAARLHSDPNPTEEVLVWVTRGLDMLAHRPDERLDRKSVV